MMSLETRLAVLEERERSNTEYTANALQKQAGEYERRLGILNGEAERLRSMQSSYVPREVYEANHKEMTKTIEDLKAARSNDEGRRTILTTVISVATSIGIGLIFSFINRYFKV